MSSNRVTEFQRLQDRLDDIEWDMFTEENGSEEMDLLEDEHFEVEARLSWLWDEMTQEEREGVEDAF